MPTIPLHAINILWSRAFQPLYIDFTTLHSVPSSHTIRHSEASGGELTPWPALDTLAAASGIL